MNAKEAIVFMFKGVSNWAPYWQFHFGREGVGFDFGYPLGSFVLGGRGGFQFGYPLGSFILGGREGGYICR